MKALLRLIGVLLFLLPTGVWAQSEMPQTRELPQSSENPQTPEKPQAPETPQTGEMPQTGEIPLTSEMPQTDDMSQTREREYRIGADDLIEVSVFEIPELGATTRVSASGFAAIPLVGFLEVQGKTPRQLSEIIEAALTLKYVKDPHVMVFVKDYGSQPVSVIGAVKMPGIYQLKGDKLLWDVLAMAQGLNENAGKTIQVIRKGDSTDDESKTISISVEDLMELGQSELNIPIMGSDVINVLTAGSIFVVGELVRPGESMLRYGRNVTISQAIALGGGFTPDAKKKEIRLIRPHPDGTKEEIVVDGQKILEGSGVDLRLMANDVLFVPASKVKSGLKRALDSALSVAIGRAIYSR